MQHERKCKEISNGKEPSKINDLMSMLHFQYMGAKTRKCNLAKIA